ncbi:hypothetical protein [Bacteroides reticulotermitis]|uniref:Uncharacterized protein n=2 Tax=Bacteroides reticulotermitis TaxID=1133319 RepID=W4UWA2_9BACE|nr:hypothetical protein [Bacteroides reticulotermitis]MBB4045744.1 hypothetical protein [Bacteroides reticulotermitis]GAE84883.1 hypothetical protein JCM10512_3259 [Bacteroides reticulotermitis JCM 10512]
MEDWMKYARDMAKAEKELDIEMWVIISFYRRTVEKENILIFRYDLPKRLADKYCWVIGWRKARLICRYPRGNVYHTYSLYDKHSGEDYSFGSDLSRLAAAKAQVTKMQRSIQDYVKVQKQGNLFFDEDKDEMLLKARNKLKIKEKNVQQAENRLHEKVESHRCGFRE